MDDEAFTDFPVDFASADTAKYFIELSLCIFTVAAFPKESLMDYNLELVKRYGKVLLGGVTSPVILNILITSVCDMRCTHCFFTEELDDSCSGSAKRLAEVCPF
jgi:hypothetical protein